MHTAISKITLGHTSTVSVSFLHDTFNALPDIFWLVPHSYTTQAVHHMELDIVLPVRLAFWFLKHSKLCFSLDILSSRGSKTGSRHEHLYILWCRTTLFFDAVNIEIAVSIITCSDRLYRVRIQIRKCISIHTDRTRYVETQCERFSMLLAPHPCPCLWNPSLVHCLQRIMYII